MRRINKFIKTSLFLISISLLAFSCALNIIPENNGKGNMTIPIPLTEDFRSIDRANEQPLSFNLEVLDSKKSIVFEGIFSEGEIIKIPNLQFDDYLVTLTAEDNAYIYSGSKKVSVNSSKEVIVSIKLNAQLKGGQITLLFNDITFDSNATFNVLVKNAEDKEVYTKSDISVSLIKDGLFSLPTYFSAGKYKVSVTGGNIDKEIYVAGNNQLFDVVQGSISRVPIFTLPYKVYYVDGAVASNSVKFGSKDNPFGTLEEAFRKITQLGITEPAKIIVSNSVVEKSTIVLNKGLNVSIVGLKNASIVANNIPILNIKGANVVLKDISFNSSNNVNSNTIIFDQGSLSLDGGVYFKDILVGTDRSIRINKDLAVGPDKIVTVKLNKYDDNVRVFDIGINTSLNKEYIKLENPNYIIDDKGFCQSKKADVTVTLTGIKEDVSQNIDQEFCYKLLEQDKEIIPLTPIDGLQNKTPTKEEAIKDRTFVIPNLSVGNNYTLILYSNYAPLGSNNISGVDNNSVAYSKTRTIPITPKIENNNITETLGEEAYSSGSIKLFTSPIELDELPLILTLTNESNGNKIIKYIRGCETYINYIEAGNYKVTLESDSLVESYKLNSNIIKVDNGVTSNLEYEVISKSVYYVSNKGTVDGIGSKQKPFKNIGKALEALKDSTSPITLMVMDDITEDIFEYTDEYDRVISTSKKDIVTPIDVTIIGSGKIEDATGTRFPQITADTGLFLLNNYSAHIDCKNINILCSNRNISDGDYSAIDILQGTFGVLDGARLTLNPTSETSFKGINIFSEGTLQLKNNAFVDSDVQLISLSTETGSTNIGKIELLSDITNKLNVCLEDPSSNIGNKIITSGIQNDSSLIERNINNISYVDDYYGTTLGKDGYIKEETPVVILDYAEAANNIEYFRYSNDPELTINVYVDNNEELNQLGELLRVIPRTKAVNLALITNESITTIDSNVFNKYGDGLDSLKTFTLAGNNINTIGNNAFSNCDKLENINLPDSVIEVRDECFSNCPLLKGDNGNFVLPKYMNSIGKNILSNCPNITGFIVGIPDSGTNTHFIKGENQKDVLDFDTQLPEDNLKTLQANNSMVLSRRIDYHGDISEVIPLLNSGNFKFIINFRERIELTDTCRDGVTIELSYSEDTHLTEISGELTSLAGILKKVYIPSNINNISCAFLQGVPDVTVEIAPENNFAKVEGNYILSKDGTVLIQYLDKTDVLVTEIPSTVNKIKGSAFVGSKLTGIKLPKDSKWITNEGEVLTAGTEEENAFALIDETSANPLAYCDLEKLLTVSDTRSLLTNPNTSGDIVLTVDASNSDISELGSIIRQYNKGKIDLTIAENNTITEINGFTNATSIRSVYLPTTVTNIAENAFSGCTSLAQINIPTNLTNIGINAFKGCTNLTTVNNQENVKLATNVFPTVRLENKRHATYYSTQSLDILKTGNAIAFTKPMSKDDAISKLKATETTGDLTLTVLVTSGNQVKSIASEINKYTKGNIKLNLIGQSDYELDVSYGSTTGIFEDCTNLIGITLDSNVTSIPSGTFYRSGLTEAYLSAPYYVVGGSQRIEYDPTTPTNVANRLTPHGTTWTREY